MQPHLGDFSRLLPDPVTVYVAQVNVPKSDIASSRLQDLGKKLCHCGLPTATQAHDCSCLICWEVQAHIA
jgi:hypothetical protein